MSTADEPSELLSVRNVFLLAAWAAALFGTLQVHQLEGLFGHAICGPWGCGPPVSALLGYHGFWFLLILPLAAIFKSRLSRTKARSFGHGFLLLSAAGIVALLLLEGMNNSAAEKYPLRWCAFRVATFVDFPLIQLGLAGLWLQWKTRSTPGSHVIETDECESD